MKEHERHEEWIARAISSLEMAKVKLTPLIYYAEPCFQAQQAAEKALKGLLFYYNEEPEFTHRIDRLLTALEKYTEIPVAVSSRNKVDRLCIPNTVPR